MTSMALLQDQNPDLISSLAQVDHTHQFIREVEMQNSQGQNEIILVGTPNVDGMFKHFRDFLWKFRVKQTGLFRYGREFELRWNCSQQKQSFWQHIMVKRSSGKKLYFTK